MDDYYKEQALEAEKVMVERTEGYNMDELEEVTIRIYETVKWKEARLEGDFRCPDCGSIMIIIGPFKAYAFCLKCEKYWIS